MNQTHARLFASILCLPLALLLPAQADDAVDNLIERMVESQATIQSLQQQSAMVVSMVIDGQEEEMTQESLLVYERPNRLALESDLISLVSDGEQLTILFETFDYFLRIPIDDDLASTLQEHEEHLGDALLPDVAALLSDDPHAFLQAFAKDLDITVLEDEDHDGRPAWVIQIQVEDDIMELSEPVKAWIDQETGLLSGLRANVDLSAYADEGIPGMPSSYTLNYRVASRVLNEDLDDALFVPDTIGFTEIADFDELLEAMEDLMGAPDVGLIGNEAPDFELTLLDGTSFRLSDQRGKVVLLDFWATWCPPCVESLPYLQAMYEEVRGDDVVFLGISVDRSNPEERVKDMVERFDLSYSVGINEDGDIAMDYVAFSIPTMVLIDRDGVIRDHKIGFHPEKMEELKAELIRLAEDTEGEE